jgi:hypothetical protein
MWVSREMDIVRDGHAIWTYMWGSGIGDRAGGTRGLGDLRLVGRWLVVRDCVLGKPFSFVEHGYCSL